MMSVAVFFSTMGKRIAAAKNMTCKAKIFTILEEMC